MADGTTSILVVEDEPKLARALAEGLEAEGYAVRVAATGDSGYLDATRERPDAVILDIMLPGRSGFDVLEALRRDGRTMPVLALTARDGVEDRVRGLDLGADDYLVKPFAFPELLARIRALLRRSVPVQNPAVLEIADLRLDAGARTVTRGGREVALTAREFDLLRFLLAHRGSVVSRGVIAADVWNVTHRATSLDNVIDVHIARIRRKVDTDPRVRLIHTVRGAGFVIREERA